MIEEEKERTCKLIEENGSLKKRNQRLEDSFIEHLTQTSLHIQHQSTKNSTQPINTTINLHE
jgi:hypothetical protein